MKTTEMNPFIDRVIEWLDDDKNTKGIHRDAVEQLEDIVNEVANESEDDTEVRKSFFDRISQVIVEIRAERGYLWRVAEGLDELRSSISQQLVG